MTTAQASKTLLDHFGQRLRSTVANMYLRPIREGRARDPRAAHAEVVRALRERREQARRVGWLESFELADAILDTITRYEADALAYAAWALAWEALSPEERRRQQGERSAQHIASIMDRQPPTEKQIAYIRRMGFTDPIPSKAFASSVIDLLTRGYEVRRRAA